MRSNARPVCPLCNGRITLPAAFRHRRFASASRLCSVACSTLTASAADSCMAIQTVTDHCGKMVHPILESRYANHALQTGAILCPIRIYEFKVKYLLSPSDCESLSMAELLQLADSDSLALWSELRLGVRSNLTSQTLQAWLRDQLFVDSDAVHLQAALAALRTEGVLDEQNRPHTERLASLIDEWGLRAWVREVSREDYG